MCVQLTTNKHIKQNKNTVLNNPVSSVVISGHSSLASCVKQRHVLQPWATQPCPCPPRLLFSPGHLLWSVPPPINYYLLEAKDHVRLCPVVAPAPTLQVVVSLSA